MISSSLRERCTTTLKTWLWYCDVYKDYFVIAKETEKFVLKSKISYKNYFLHLYLIKSYISLWHSTIYKINSLDQVTSFSLKWNSFALLAPRVPLPTGVNANKNYWMITLGNLLSVKHQQTVWTTIKF